MDSSKLIERGGLVYHLKPNSLFHGKGVKISDTPFNGKAVKHYSSGEVQIKATYKKRYGKLTALILFLPTLLRIIFRICLNTISGNKVTKSKYQIRLNGLINSIKNNKSFKRIEDF